MTVQQLVFREEARDKIRRSVDALTDAVKVTLGLRGRTVVLCGDVGPPRSFMWGARGQVRGAGGELEMVQLGLRCLTVGANPVDLKRGMEEAIAVVVEELPRFARPCASSQEVRHVASISANNERFSDGLRAEAAGKAGAATGIGSKERTVRGEAVLRGGRVALQPVRRGGAQPRGSNLDRDSGSRPIAQASVPGPQPGCRA